MAYIDNTFVSKQAFIMENYQRVMESKFLVELKGFLEYTKLLNLLGFWNGLITRFQMWCPIWCNGLKSFIHKDKAHWFMEVTKLCNCATFFRWG